MVTGEGGEGQVLVYCNYGEAFPLGPSDRKFKYAFASLNEYHA